MQRNGIVAVAGGMDANGNALNTTEAYGYPTVQTLNGDLGIIRHFPASLRAGNLQGRKRRLLHALPSESAIDLAIGEIPGENTRVQNLVLKNSTPSTRGRHPEKK
jgi:hypothetical protein